MIARSSICRMGLITIGWSSLILGAIGIFLPLLPTTPFILLSAYCFSKSSPQLHQWLLRQPTLGPMIHNWECYGSISRGAKITATVLMVVLFSLSLFFVHMSMMIKVGLLTLAGAVLSYIWTRPSRTHGPTIPDPVGIK